MEKEAFNDEVDESTFAKEALQCEIGARLQQAREAQGLTFEYIVQELKFSPKFLTALEAGNWQDLPGEVYAIGFLKQYASLLNIDLSDDIQRIKSNDFELKTPVVYHDVPISPQRKWAVGAVLVFVLIILVGNIFTIEKASFQPHTEQATIEPQAQPLVIQPEIIESSSNTDPYSTSMIEKKAEENTEVAIQIQTPKTFTFHAATDDVWLQVFALDEQGKRQLLREALLKKGDRFSIVETSAKLFVTAGNPRALEVLEDGSVLFAADTLGKKNKVLKNFPINP